MNFVAITERANFNGGHNSQVYRFTAVTTMVSLVLWEYAQKYLGRGVLPASQKHYVQNCLTRGRERTVLKGAIYGVEGSCLNRAAMSRSLGYLPTQN